MSDVRSPGRRCLGVGTRRCDQLVRRGSRCPECLARHTAARDRSKYKARRREGKRTGSTRAWRALRDEIFVRDNWTCRACGRCDPTGRTLHLDHIKPKSEGGSDHPLNLQTLCASCNLAKGSK